jgi:hypothetical protein
MGSMSASSPISCCSGQAEIRTMLERLAANYEVAKDFFFT